MIVAIDTNILAYAEGINGAPMKKRALDLLERLPQDVAVVPVQALGELFHVLVRKANWSPARARAAVIRWGDAFPLVDSTASVMLGAADLAADHGFGIWDAVMLSAAREAGCRILLSEDLQDGFTWSGLTVANPFAPERHALLDSLLDDGE